MDLKEKAGDLLIDLAKLIFAGVILSSIITENINTVLLYGIGITFCVILIFIGFYFYKQSKKTNKRRK